MTMEIKNPIERMLCISDHRGRPIVSRVTIEGTYFKLKGERWTSAVFLPWGAAYTQACFRQAEFEKAEKKRLRQERRGR